MRIQFEPKQYQSKIVSRCRDNGYETPPQKPSLSLLPLPPVQYLVTPLYEGFDDTEHSKWRDIRAKVLGVAWRLLDETMKFDPRPFTLRSRWWSIDPDGLELMLPRDMLNYLSLDINEVADGVPLGYLLGFLHCEFDQDKERFQFFVRGIACGDMVDAVDGLRHIKKFWSGDGEQPSVHIKEPITDIRATVEGLFHPHCSTTYHGPTDNDGNRLDDAHFQDQYFTNSLVWLPDDTVEEICFGNNLRLSDDMTHLVPTRLMAPTS